MEKRILIKKAQYLLQNKNISKERRKELEDLLEENQQEVKIINLITQILKRR